jgi:hypothetical protein
MLVAAGRSGVGTVAAKGSEANVELAEQCNKKTNIYEEN